MCFLSIVSAFIFPCGFKEKAPERKNYCKSFVVVQLQLILYKTGVLGRYSPTTNPILDSSTRR